MNILMIYSYPNHEGFNYAIKETIEKSLTGKNTLREIDLYQEQFNPSLYFDKENKRRNLDKDPETQKYREMVEWADFLIFIYPIWWSGMPAILKGFIDRVFAKGFAYIYKGIMPVGLLKGKRAWIVNTHDTPEVYAKFLQKDYGRVLKKQILKMCGINTYKHTTMPFLRNSTPEKRAKFLNKISAISKNL